MTNIKQIKELKATRLSLISFRDDNFCQYNDSESLHHQACCNVIGMLFKAIKKLDDNYFGDDKV